MEEGDRKKGGKYVNLHVWQFAVFMHTREQYKIYKLIGMARLTSVM